MAKKLLIGSLLAAVVLMLWGFISWAMLAGQLGIVRTLPNEAEVRAALSETISETGTYFLPTEGFEGDAEARGAWAERHAEGPLVFLHYRDQGVRPTPLQMLKGFLHFWLAALLAGVVLVVASPIVEYKRRVKLVFVVGLFAAVAIHLGPSVWWYAPWTYSLYAVAAEAVAWLLAGLVLARFVKPA